MPLLLVCEDNGVGISTSTPDGWIEAAVRARPALPHFPCDGRDALDVYRAAAAAAQHVRRRRQPAFLHMRTVRLLGHAGSDAEVSYRSEAKIQSDEAQDPLLVTASTLINRGLLDAQAIVTHYHSEERRIEALAAEAVTRPHLENREQVTAALWAPRNRLPSPPPADRDAREALFRRDARQFGRPLPMARHINLALADIMLRYPSSILFGEDVARKGGVYGVTQGLLDKFGPARVMNTLLDEQSILGLAIGLAQCGYLPIPEIQYLAYLHNAEDQLRGEAATLPFFSNGQFANPMVVRIAGLAYQKGFGGHFHNDNSVAVLRDIPGIIVVTPSSGREAAALLHTSVELAQRHGRVVVFLEPIALYHTVDLHTEGDGAWAESYADPGDDLTINEGQVGVCGEGTDLAIVSYANGFFMSHQAARQLTETQGIDCRLIDLRWLQPLPETALLDAVRDCRRVLIVDECRRSGSVSEALMGLFGEQTPDLPVARITAADSFIPLGDAAYAVLPDRDAIVAAARELCAP